MKVLCLDVPCFSKINGFVLQQQTMFSPNPSPGLHNVPISMSLLGYSVISCAALNIPSLFNLQKYFICNIPEDLMKNRQFWKLLTTKLVFLDPKDLIWGATLMYQFREFERRYGSHKFTSVLFGTSCISFVLELIFLLIKWFIDKDFGSGFLPTGPFYHEIPNVGGARGNSRSQSSSSFSGQEGNAPFTALGSLFPPITTKTLTYFFGFQLIWTSTNSLNSALFGIVSGVLHHKNFFGVQNWLVVPNWMAKLTRKVFSTVVGNLAVGGQGGSNNGNNQGRWSRVEHAANSDEGTWQRHIRRQGQGFAETLVYPENQWAATQNGGNIFGGFLGNWRQHNLIDNEDVFNAEEFDRERGDGVEVEELEVEEEDSVSGSSNGQRSSNNVNSDLVNTLVDMGFHKEHALRALKSTNYDLMDATNLLLRTDSSSEPS
ncbi:hypothetical protein J437_LFUL007281 [Ladona fulva]|uniref:UBA domain-containing protein n=1 Tax=Ladona fulva TaxID=123851 RepID=A0A8K0K2W6_LADFU|nr:hypothetical protein J437_LFUL007281 [Ladona fulva]